MSSEAAGPFGVASSVSPETAEIITVTVGCDYKWTIQLFEKLDYDPALNVSSSRAHFSAQAPCCSYCQTIITIIAHIIAAPQHCDLL